MIAVEEAARKLRAVFGSRVEVRADSEPRRGDQPRLVLPEIIYSRGRHGGYTHVLVIGELGSGKSTYAFRTCYQLLDRHRDLLPPRVRDQWPHWDLDDRYQWILENLTAYTVEELLEILAARTWRSRAPCVIWDDAGVHGSSLLFFTDRKAYQALSALFQVVRTRAWSIIITVPITGMVAKKVREIPEAVVVLVDRLDDLRSRALGFRQRQGVRRQYYDLAFVDYFTRKLPDRFYKEYMMYRDFYVTDVISMWARLLEERKRNR